MKILPLETPESSALQQRGCEEGFVPRAFEEGFPGCRLQHTPDYVHLAFEKPRAVLSSAVLNGGFSEISHLLNLKVAGVSAIDCESPEHTLSHFIQEKGWQGRAIGMMTAASMRSLRIGSENIEGEQIAVLVTTGLANARRAGDPAEYRQLTESVTKLGTINAVVLTTVALSPAAMAETLMVATEAKAAVLQERGVRSPVSGGIATGTGTDSIAVISGAGISHGVKSGEAGARLVSYAGKHTLLGEKVAQLMIQCISDSLDYPSGEGI